jgi:hypothetical protein
MGGFRSSIRSLPLGAKVGIAVIPIVFAWPLIFRAFDGFSGRTRLRPASLGVLLL